MQCWESKKCGRIPRGGSEKEMGVCPAYIRHAGQACWLVAGTFCGGKVQGSFAQKEQSCMSCDFYKTFDLNHRMKMKQIFA